MSTIDQLQTGWTEIRAIGRLLSAAPRLLPKAPWNAARLLDERAAKDGDVVGIAFLDRRYTWRQIDSEVNRYARAFQTLGIGHGQTVALLMDNRPEFLFALTALSRLNAVAALINTNVTGRALAHAINVAAPSAVLVGSEHAQKLGPILGDFENIERADVLVQRDDGTTADGDFPSLDEALASATDARPTSGVSTPSGDQKMCYIYTSGTTGLPKAAIITNQRWLAAAAFFGRGIIEATPADVIYATLPLYHSNAMFAGWGSALMTGATIALRRKFSASSFWSDVRNFDATAFIYIGELCRYLMNQPEQPDDANNKLRIATGNGLRPDIWPRFQKRFGIPLIREFYGATEGNLALVNLSGRPGMVGRLRSGQVVVRCDLASGEIQRQEDGSFERLGAGETGLLIGRIGGVTSYDGYIDAEATRKKVLEGVFKPGDRYFNSGDLVTLHEGGWVSFADRVGDTFRWKGENVSTNEVAEILNGAPNVLESNVYGVEVPGSEGRAGMASLNCTEDFSIEEFAAYINSNLPVYQRPYFVRLQHDMRITGTFKHQKVDYRKEGFDPAQVKDPLYFLDGKSFIPLDEELHRKLQSGEVAPR
jgi:acyl-CoA synthetase (AMP-forming)/AMP-acid ligase II